MSKRKDGLLEKTITISGKRIHFYGKTMAEINRKIRNYNFGIEYSHTFGYITEEWLEHVENEVGQTTYVTYVRYAKFWESCFGNDMISTITSSQIQNAINKYSQINKHSYKTVSNCLSVLRLILGYAIIHDEINSNPSEYVKIPHGLSRRQRGFPESDIIKAVIDNRDDSMIAKVYFFALFTGLRKGEIFALQWKDFDVDNMVIHVTKSVKWINNVPSIGSTKTVNGVRDVPLLSDVKTSLVFGNPDDYVFSNNGEIPHESWITRRIKKYQEETGISLGLHEMRHGYATICFERGIAVKSVQHLLGHSQSSTTLDIYTHWQKGSLEEARGKLENSTK